MAKTEILPVAEARDRAIKLIDSLADDLAGSLPESLKADRFKAAFLNLAVHTPEIFKCNPDSIRSALLKCASDGLVPDGRLAALVPFRQSDPPDLLAQYIPMVQGIIARARELGETLSITANVVYANDQFLFDESDPSDTIHKRPVMNTDRGAIVAAYAIFRDNHGRVMHREIMDQRELEKTRNVSKAKDSPAWRNWLSEMYRKTVIRRGGKYIAMSEALRRIVEREDEYVDFDSVPEALPIGYNPLKDRRPAAIAHQPGEGVPIDTGAAREPATADRPAAETLPSASGAATQDEPKKSVDKPAEPKKPAALSDAQKARLTAYDKALGGELISTEIGNASSRFWGDQFPDEGTLLYDRVMLIFNAHMARANGKGIIADAEAALAKAIA